MTNALLVIYLIVLSLENQKVEITFKMTMMDMLTLALQIEIMVCCLSQKLVRIWCKKETLSALSKMGMDQRYLDYIAT